MNFKEWLLIENESRTGTRLGLYPSIYDSLGQYPPLYSTPISADFITYYDIQYGKKGVRDISPGIVDPIDTYTHKINRFTWLNFSKFEKQR